MKNNNLPNQIQSVLEEINSIPQKKKEQFSISSDKRQEVAKSQPLPIPECVKDFLTELEEEKRQRGLQYALWEATSLESINNDVSSLEDASPISRDNTATVSSAKVETVVTQKAELSIAASANHQNQITNTIALTEDKQIQTYNNQDSTFDAESWFSKENLEDTADYLENCPDLEIFEELVEALPREAIQGAIALLSPPMQVKIKQWLIVIDTEKNKNSIPNNLQPTENPAIKYRENYLYNQEEATNYTSDSNKTSPITYNLVETDSDLETAITTLGKASVLAIDVETTGLDPHIHQIRLIQIATPNHPVVILDLDKIKNLAPLQALFSNQAVKVGHNLKFDHKFLTMAGLTLTPPLFDTQIAHQLLRAGIKSEYSLKHLSQFYLDKEIDKQLQRSDWSQQLNPSQLEYAALDAAILLPLREILKPKLIEADLTLVAKIEMNCIPAVAAMELAGMPIDITQWQQLAESMESNAEKSAQELKKLLQSSVAITPNLFTGEAAEIDVNSPNQVLKALQAMGIPVKSTAKKVIAPLASQYPVINALIEYRHWSKAKTSFGSTLPKHIHNKTGRIHAQYWQIGAVSGRFSCSNPNLQQIPRQKAVRQCFIPPPGNSLIIADYSQIELRIAAEISGDAKMIQAYQREQDLHKLTASLVLGKAIEAITKEDRQLAKAINFGLIYGISAMGLQSYAECNYGVKMTETQAQQFRKKFFTGYSGLARWQQQQAKLLYQRGVRETRTLANRRRQWQEKPRLTEMLNTPVQGTSADITKLALADLLPYLAPMGAKILGVVHDEIILSSPESQSHQAAQILTQVMQAAGERFLQRVPVVVEAQIAQSWGDK